MPKVPVFEHTTSYQSINHKSPQGLQCLKTLFAEYDNVQPSRMTLNSLFARDFQDHENGSDRSVGRDEAMDNIISGRAKCTKHQTDLRYARCIVNSGASHSVFFEGIRFLLLEGDSDFIRVPFSGRIEVKIKENRLTLKDPVAEISSRRVTSDNTQLLLLSLKRDEPRPAPAPVQAPTRPMSTSSPLASPPSNTSSGQLPPLIYTAVPSVTELPAAHASGSSDTKSLPPYTSAQEHGSGSGTEVSPTITTGSFADGDTYQRHG